MATKSTLIIDGTNLGGQFDLTVIKAQSSYTHTIVINCGAESVTLTKQSAGDSYGFHPPLSWASYNTTGTIVPVKFTITTYNGDTSLGSISYTVNCNIPDNVAPTCDVALSDTTGHKDTYGDYVQGKSKLKIDVTLHEAYGSPIKQVQVGADGYRYGQNSFYSEIGDAYSVVSNALRYTGSRQVEVKLLDERYRQSLMQSAYTVLAYSAPSITKLTVGRCTSNGTADDKGEYVKVTFSSIVSSLNRKNTAKYVLRWKKTSEASYPSSQTRTLTNYANKYSVTDGYAIIAADSGYAYDIKIEVTDGFETIDKTTSVSSGFTIMHFLASGLGMGIGKVAELANVLDIGFKTRFFGGILLKTLSDDTNLNTLKVTSTYRIPADNELSNLPLSGVGGFLDISASENEATVHQTFRIDSKDNPMVYERTFSDNSWGSWNCVSFFGNKILLDTGTDVPCYMDDTVMCTFSECVSKQKNGIVLAWSYYYADKGLIEDYRWNHIFIPKETIKNFPGQSICMFLTDTLGTAVAIKSVFITDNTITGYSKNSAGYGLLSSKENFSNIYPTNNEFVLRYVYGV